MSLFVTWKEVSDYVTQTKGYEYLTNPTSWMESFKEVVSDARWVGVEGGQPGGGFIYNQPVDWIDVGKPVAPALDGGVKSLPSVTSVITNTTTGAVVAGETAVATEAVGTTITLTAAGWIATALTGLGLGVAAYEVAPHFWTDISNAIFEPITGHHLDYDETEPFLRKKLKTLLSTDNNNKIVTYIDADMLQRAYDFIKTHINSDGYDVYDQYTWNTPSPIGDVVEQYTPYYVGEQTFDVEVGRMSLTDDAIQSVIHETQLVIEKIGGVEVEPSAVGIVNNLRSLYPNFSNANVIRIKYSYYYVSPTVQARDVYIDGIKADDDNHIIHATTFRKSYNQLYRRLRVGDTLAQADNSDFGYEVLLKDKNNQDVTPQNDFLFSYRYDINTQTGTVIDTGMSYIGTNICNLGYWPSYAGMSAGCDLTLISPLFDSDNYLKENGVVPVGKTPVKNTNFQDRYAEWYGNKKSVGQPNKDGGTDTVKNFVPANIPMQPTDTDKIINNGVNVSSDSYNDDQDANQNGQDTPTNNPIENFNDSVNESIDDYNSSDVDPEHAPDPSPDPLPEYPPDPPDDPKGDSGDTPDPADMPGMTASGMVSVYNPTKEQIINFSAWLWSSNFFDNFLKLLQNPLEAIIGLHIMYATPITGTPANIVVGYLDSGVSSKVVTQQYIDIDCGTVNIPEYYGDVLDYEPYVHVHIYLPFVGMVSLKPNDVIGKTVNVTYGVDVLTGTCLARITVDKGSSSMQLYQFPGNCAVQIPLTGGNYAGMIRALASMAVGVAGSVVTANPLPAIGGVIGGATSASLDVSHGGSLGANAGAMGIRKPYIIITRRSAYDASNYNQYYGYPTNKTVSIGSCKGYTRIKSVHIDTIARATDSEKTEIETLLKQGVIIK